MNIYNDFVIIYIKINTLSKKKYKNFYQDSEMYGGKNAKNN